MRIFLAGGGDAAIHLAEKLAAEHDLVVISPAISQGSFDHLDLQLLTGSSTNIEIYRQAGLNKDDRVIACHEQDELNLLTCLVAHRVAEAESFCFVSNEEYFRSFGSERQEDSLPGLDHLIWPQYLLAEEISRIVLVPEAIDVQVFARGRVWLMELRVSEESALVAKPLSTLAIPKGILITTVVRGEEVLIPDGHTVLEPDDKVVLMGRRRALRSIARSFVATTSRVGSVTIVGGGTVGVALAKILEESASAQIKVIEISRERCDVIAAQLDSALVIHGDGTDVSLLEQEEVGRCSVLVSVTSSDEKNLLGSLLARQLGIPKVITRVNEPANVRLFESVGIDVPLSPSLAATAEVMHALRGTSLELLAALEHGRVQVVQLEVPTGFPEAAIQDLAFPDHAIIGAILHRFTTVVPSGADRVKAGDRLLVVATEASRDSLDTVFQITG